MKKLITIISFLFFLIYFINAQAIESIKYQDLPHNLAQINHDQLSRDADAVYQKTDKASTYSLSIPLLAYGLLADEQYKTVLQEMDPLIRNEFPAAHVTAWLSGRMVAAADTFGDRDSANSAKRIIERLLNINYLDYRDEDQYTAWALGYLGHHSKIDYMLNKSKLLENCYQVEKDKKIDLSSKLWSWVMCAYASARVGDYETFDLTIHEMEILTNTRHLNDALNKIPASDFRAWAYAMMRVASITLEATTEQGSTQNYLQQYKDLEKFTLEAISNSPNAGDKLLAQLNNELSKECFKYILRHKMPPIPVDYN